MGKITIKNGKGELSLRKSQKFIGLKTVSSRGTEEDFVEKEVLKNLGGFKVVSLKQEGLSLDEKLDEIREKEEVKVGTHVYYAEGSKRPLIATGELFILFEEGTSTEEQNIVLDEFNLELVERRSNTNIVAKVTSKSPNPIKVAHRIQQISLVKHVEPDLDTLLDEYDEVEPSDDLFKHEWHLQNEGFVVDANWRLKKGADSKVLDAWKRLENKGSSDVVVAVIDNGFDLTHPDLEKNLFRPFDLWNQSDNLLQGDPRYTHGTPCASVAVAASNDKGIVGAAPNARFMPVSGTSFSLRATEQMFEYCIANGADIISCSWGTTDPAFSLSPLKEEAIAKAVREGRNGKGCIILYAVGNDDVDYVNYYAAHPDVIGIAACTSKDKHASYSNRGREVCVSAPSNGDWPIIAARANWDEGIPWETGTYKYWRDGKSRGMNYKHFGGTSSACPLVAGICALILSANPDLTAKEVKEILQKTADKIGDPSEYFEGHSTKYGYGRVNADRAVAEAIRRRDGIEQPEVEDSIAKGRGIFRFSVERQESKGWGVQIGAFAEYGNVLIQAEKLQRMFGEPVIVSINELEGSTVYKVVVGVFEKKSDANKLLQRMKEDNVNGFPRNLEDLK
ncbi:MAG: S8 family serine peptidase [Bacteroidetes bacterium]|nr:S8 family serine peptidase [Bacteroidota bacterium]